MESLVSNPQITQIDPCNLWRFDFVVELPRTGIIARIEILCRSYAQINSLARNRHHLRD